MTIAEELIGMFEGNDLQAQLDKLKQDHQKLYDDRATEMEKVSKQIEADEQKIATVEKRVLGLGNKATTKDKEELAEVRRLHREKSSRLSSEVSSKYDKLLSAVEDKADAIEKQLRKKP